MKQVFIASLGGAPAVITEALWALMHPSKLADPASRDHDPVVPRIVHIVSTAYHRGYPDTDARDEDIREKIETLYRQYGHKPPEITIEMVRDAEDHAFLEDIRSIADNTAMSNHLTRVVAGYCGQDDTRVHTSLAGGRKTMSSYLQSAMMFFGRDQDQLIHVLLGNSDYEFVRDFWWPDQDWTLDAPTGRDGKPREGLTLNGIHLDTSARAVGIDLVRVPFVKLKLRLPDGVPPEARNLEFLVECEELERRNAPLILNLKEKTVTFGKETIKLPPAEFAVYATYAIARHQNWQGHGPQEEGSGPNAGGYIVLDDLWGGPRKTSRNQETIAWKVMKEIYEKVTPLEGDHDFIANVEEESDRYSKDGTTKVRSNLGRVLRTNARNPNFISQMIPESYGRQPVIVGLRVPGSRIELKNFPEYILRVYPSFGSHR